MVYWVGTSWKMNKTLAEALDFAEALAGFMPGFDHAHPALRHPALHRGARGQAGARRRRASRSARRTCIGPMPAPGPARSRR